MEEREIVNKKLNKLMFQIKRIIDVVNVRLCHSNQELLTVMSMAKISLSTNADFAAQQPHGFALVLPDFVILAMTMLALML